MRGSLISLPRSLSSTTAIVTCSMDNALSILQVTIAVVEDWVRGYLFPNEQACGLGLQFKYEDSFVCKISEQSKVNDQK